MSGDREEISRWTRRGFLQGVGVGAVSLSAGKWLDGKADAAERSLARDAAGAFAALRTQQTQRLCSCGLPARMGLSDDEFVARVPALGPATLRSLKEGEDLLLVVPENLVGAMEQMQLASLRILIDPSRKKEDNPLPNGPYWIGWRLVGRDTSGHNECVYDPRSPERPPSLIEGVHLAIQYPELLENLAVALTSTSMPNGHTGILCYWRGKPQISVICRTAANSYAAMGGQLMLVRELSEESAA